VQHLFQGTATMDATKKNCAIWITLAAAVMLAASFMAVRRDPCFAIRGVQWTSVWRHERQRNAYGLERQHHCYGYAASHLDQRPARRDGGCRHLAHGDRRLAATCFAPTCTFDSGPRSDVGKLPLFWDHPDRRRSVSASSLPLGALRPLRFGHSHLRPTLAIGNPPPTA